MNISEFFQLPQWKEYYPEHNLRALTKAELFLKNGGSRLVYVAGIFIQEKFSPRRESLLVSDEIDFRGNLKEVNLGENGLAGYFSQVPLEYIVKYHPEPLA